MLNKKEPEVFTYEEAAAYIEEIPKFTKKHTLEHTKLFLKRLGNPAVDRKIVHVAGTNGKGSVCAYLQAILMAEGKRTGFFTSPHLVSVNERIRMDNVQCLPYGHCSLAGSDYFLSDAGIEHQVNAAGDCKWQ